MPFITIRDGESRGCCERQQGQVAISAVARMERKQSPAVWITMGRRIFVAARHHCAGAWAHTLPFYPLDHLGTNSV